MYTITLERLGIKCCVYYDIPHIYLFSELRSISYEIVEKIYLIEIIRWQLVCSFPIPVYPQTWNENKGDKFGRVGFTRGDFTHPMEFTEEYHDFVEKHVLGQTIPANLSGEDDIKKAVSIIMSNPNVAPYISKNLIMRLTKSNPSPAYIQRITTVFNETNGSLAAVTKAILLD